MNTVKEIKIFDFQYDGSICGVIVDEDELVFSTEDSQFFVDGQLQENNRLTIGMNLEAAAKIRDFLNYAIPK